MKFWSIKFYAILKLVFVQFLPLTNFNVFQTFSEVVHPYIAHRCRQSVDFSLQCAWLLEAYSPASLEGLTKKNRSHGIKLKNLIMSGNKKEKKQD